MAPDISLVRIAPQIIQRMLMSACANSSWEICGLLGGRVGVITHAFPATNVTAEPTTAYEIASEEIFERMREMRNAGLELLGIYHSHPNGKNEPSPRDIESAYYPDVAYFIISPLPDAARPLRAFSIRDGRVAELEVQVVSAGGPDDQPS